MKRIGKLGVIAALCFTLFAGVTVGSVAMHRSEGVSVYATSSDAIAKMKEDGGKSVGKNEPHDIRGDNDIIKEGDSGSITYYMYTDSVVAKNEDVAKLSIKANQNERLVRFDAWCETNGEGNKYITTSCKNNDDWTNFRNLAKSCFVTTSYSFTNKQLIVRHLIVAAENYKAKDGTVVSFDVNNYPDFTMSYNYPLEIAGLSNQNSFALGLQLISVNAKFVILPEGSEFNVAGDNTDSDTLPDDNGVSTTGITVYDKKIGSAKGEAVRYFEEAINGFSISFKVKATAGTGKDWSSVVINNNGLTITLPNLDNWWAGEETGFPQSNLVPSAKNKEEGFDWDCFLQGDCYVTLTVTTSEIVYYKNGQKAIHYYATDVLNKREDSTYTSNVEATVGNFAKALTKAVSETGFAAGNGETIESFEDLYVTNALNATQAKAMFDHFDSSKHLIVNHAAKAATCTKIGWDAYETCALCDYHTYVKIPALGHTLETIPAVKAEFMKDGLTAGKKCSVCEEITVKQTVVPATTYTFGGTDVGWVTVDPNAVDPNKIVPSYVNGEFETTVIFDQVSSMAQNYSATHVRIYSDNNIFGYLRMDRYGWRENNGNDHDFYECPDSACNYNDWAIFKKDINGAKVAITFRYDKSNLYVFYSFTTKEDKEYHMTYKIVNDHNELDYSKLSFQLCVEQAKPTITSIHGGTYGTILKSHTPAPAVVENEILATFTENGSYDSVVKCAECDFEMSRETVVTQANGAAFKSASLTLDGTIYLNINFNVYGDFVANGGYAKITRTEYDGTNFNPDQTRKVLFNKMTDMGNGVYRYSLSMTPAQFGDDIELKLYTGTDELIATTTTSVKKYAEWLSKSSSQVSRDLAKAILNYGSAMQEYIDYKTSDLANKDLSDADKVAVDNHEIYADEAYKVKAENNLPAEAKVKVSVTMSFSSTNAVRFKVTLPDGVDISDYAFTLDGDARTPVKDGEIYVIEVSNINALHLNDMYTLRITYSVEGEDYTAWAKYGAWSFAQRATNPNVQKVMKALQLYHEAARAYDAANPVKN